MKHYLNIDRINPRLNYGNSKHCEWRHSLPSKSSQSSAEFFKLLASCIKQNGSRYCYMSLWVGTVLVENQWLTRGGKYVHKYLQYSLKILVIKKY